MDTLPSLLIQSQNNLDRLRMRVRYCLSAQQEVETDMHKQYGPYSEYWAEWYDEAIELQEAICEDIVSSESFVLELREFMLLSLQTVTDLPQSNAKQNRRMVRLAKESIACQKDMLKIADEQIALHRQLTDHLLFVEAVGGQSE